MARLFQAGFDFFHGLRKGHALVFRRGHVGIHQLQLRWGVLVVACAAHVVGVGGHFGVKCACVFVEDVDIARTACVHAVFTCFGHGHGLVDGGEGDGNFAAVGGHHVKGAAVVGIGFFSAGDDVDEFFAFGACLGAFGIGHHVDMGQRARFVVDAQVARQIHQGLGVAGGHLAGVADRAGRRRRF